MASIKGKNSNRFIGGFKAVHFGIAIRSKDWITQHFPAPDSKYDDYFIKKTAEVVPEI